MKKKILKYNYPTLDLGKGEAILNTYLLYKIQTLVLRRVEGNFYENDKTQVSYTSPMMAGHT